MSEATERLAGLLRVRPREEWHEDMGAVLWWDWPVSEPPYAGSPDDDDFPEYMTHFSRIPPVWDTTEHKQAEEAVRAAAPTEEQ